MARNPAQPLGHVLDGRHAAHAARPVRSFVVRLPAARLDRQHQVGRFPAQVGLTFRVEGDDRKPGRHPLCQRQSEAFVAQGKQDVGLPVPVRDAPGSFLRVHEADARIVRRIVAVAETRLDDETSLRVVREG
jgi:hypothetical protein